MELGLLNQLFIVGGASSGLGKAIAEALLQEGAHIIAVARGAEKLNELYGNNKAVTIVAADITEQETITLLKSIIGEKVLHGIVVNAGGPPAKMVLYKNILRWKIALTQTFVPLMMKNGYGRMLFVESSSVKQPIENLVLSTSLRLAVVGMVKTLSQEISRSGVTVNIIAPGSHDTPAIERLYNKKVEQTGLDFNEVKTNAINQIPIGALGTAEDFASLAVWLLSEKSKYITGQTITVDGGAVKGTL
jgi:3-oxoacyl-[acyl-carrier protein] reductase